VCIYDVVFVFCVLCCTVVKWALSGVIAHALFSIIARDFLTSIFYVKAEMTKGKKRKGAARSDSQEASGKYVPQFSKKRRINGEPEDSEQPEDFADDKAEVIIPTARPFAHTV